MTEAPKNGPAGGPQYDVLHVSYGQFCCAMLIVFQLRAVKEVPDWETAKTWFMNQDPRIVNFGIKAAGRVMGFLENNALMPMDAAPKNGTWVQIWVKESFWKRCKWDRDIGCWVADSGHRLALFDPVCWRAEYPPPSPERLGALHP